MGTRAVNSECENDTRRGGRCQGKTTPARLRPVFEHRGLDETLARDDAKESARVLAVHGGDASHLVFGGVPEDIAQRLIGKRGNERAAYSFPAHQRMPRRSTSRKFGSRHVTSSCPDSKQNTRESLYFRVHAMCFMLLEIGRAHV